MRPLGLKRQAVSYMVEWKWKIFVTSDWYEFIHKQEISCLTTLQWFERQDRWILISCTGSIKVIRTWFSTVYILSTITDRIPSFPANSSWAELPTWPYWASIGALEIPNHQQSACKVGRTSDAQLRCHVYRSQVFFMIIVETCNMERCNSQVMIFTYWLLDITLLCNYLWAEKFNILMNLLPKPKS